MPDQDDTLETNAIAGNYDNSPADRPTPDARTQGSLADNPLISTPKDGSAPNTEQPTAGAANESDYVTGAQQANATNAASTNPGDQPNTYGGNFGNSVEPVHHDQGRASNQRADPNRGEFGEQGELGATHGGYGNQFREVDTAAEHPAAEATEEKYYGDGASRPGPQHNSYQNYDGQDERPVEQGHAMRDTPAARVLSFDQPTTPTSGEGNTRDTRNDVGETGPNAAFQNDNGAPTVGAAYAADYGHTSGVSLPASTPSHHLDMGPDGHGLGTDPASARGGYDGQQSEATTSHQGGAPAPVNSPDAPQTEGYGYGHERSEQEQPGNPKTGDSRNGFGPGGSKEGNVSQGHGSEGGSYDDENPGARGPGYDNFTQQDKAQNYGQGQREGFRPEDGDKPAEADDTAPRRNAGRDEA
jgi:hypothetical protein